MSLWRNIILFMLITMGMAMAVVALIFNHIRMRDVDEAQDRRLDLIEAQIRTRQ
jgi:hypothetical protein